jgi:CubicO group peptidase (beta-lactamase class C family)
LENTGLDRTLLTEMIKKIIDGTYPNVHSVLIIKDGKLVFEEYFYEYDRNKLHELRSATKSFVSALTGIAIEKGFIKSKNEEVLSYFPEYSIKNNSDQKKKITIEHLLANQSGLDCDITDPKSEGNETVMSNSEDWVKFTLDLPMIDSAGGKGRYCSGNPVTLGRIIEKATGKPLPEFARLTLFNDLGITKFKWSFKPDKSSSETFCQVYLNSRDMAKFGLLYLNKGKLNGNQIIPSDWVQQSLTKHSVVQGVDYGYLWWIKYLDVDGVRYYGKAAQGNGGQKIYVWEQQNMVTVITGGNFNSQSPSDEIIRKYILPSFKKK